MAGLSGQWAGIPAWGSWLRRFSAIRLLGASLDVFRRSVAIRRMVGAGLILLAGWSFVLTLGIPAGHTHN